tara:strand:+ start:480 stop:662 length:183 start_codon:yes stop_codon:yes gene_type:complete
MNELISSDFLNGAREARAQVANGDIYDVDNALYLFKIDPADNEFQRGFESYLRVFLKGKR